ncbi:hypothetical protein AB833_27825 [Chromatiales bacterium (ex Bugula neritina AB1)]|nr:hypothetical protein AB833_27825 [Chromatiales bacterium (ex Bugula neritina AB1)]
MRRFISVIGMVSLFLSAGAHSDEDKISFPENYRATYTNYLSLDRTQNPDQVIRLFANDIAMQGPGEDGKLPYGSILVAEVYKARLDSEGAVVTSSLGRRIKDKFALVAVMQRGEGWGEQYAEGIRNGNWEMAAFKPDGSKANKDINACLACHAPLTESNFVFSYDHLVK